MLCRFLSSIVSFPDPPRNAFRGGSGNETSPGTHGGIGSLVVSVEKTLLKPSTVFPSVAMVRMNVLNDALASICNAKRRGKRHVLLWLGTDPLF